MVKKLPLSGLNFEIFNFGNKLLFSEEKIRIF